MKSVLISNSPKQCQNIINRKQTIIIKKTRPKLETPFKCYIYELKGKKICKVIDVPEECGSGCIDIYEREGRGKVIGEFLCDGIISHCEMANADIAEQQGKIKREDLFKYANGKELYGWHISDLKIYDKPKKLSEFKKINRECYFSDLGLAIPECRDCKYRQCMLSRPFKSWGYVEDL